MLFFQLADVILDSCNTTVLRISVKVRENSIRGESSQHVDTIMSAFRAALSSLRLPTTLSLFGLSRPLSSQTPQASTSHFLIRQPSPIAIRESPYPIVFIRTPGLSSPDSQENEDWKTWTGMFAEKGYTSIEIDVVPPSYSTTPFAAMVGVLATQIRTLGIPFPPVIVATGRACLLSQAYIEDYAASGLVMVNPTGDEDDRDGSLGDKGKEWEWPKLGYEPHFPILVIADQAKLEGLKKSSRIVRAAENGVGRGGKGVSVESLVDGVRGEGSRNVSPVSSTIARRADDVGGREVV